MEKYIITEHASGGFAVRDSSWAGCWNDGVLVSGRSKGVFDLEDDANDYANMLNRSETALRLNPDISLVNKIHTAIQRNGGHCPCVPLSGNTVCPCKDMIIKGVCHCSLFVGRVSDV